MLERFLDAFGNVDLRIVAGILAILSIVGGVFLNFYSLLILTAIPVIIGFCILLFTPKGPPGTSGDWGFFLIVSSSCICLIIPAWLVYGLKLIITVTN